MRKLILAQFLTLDGVCQAPGGAEEDPEGGFAYGGWQASYLGEDDRDIMAPIFNNMGAMLLGRKTYDIFASYWPTVGKGQEPLFDEDTSIAGVMNDTPKYVASHADTIMDWPDGNVTHLGTDLAVEINQLKQQGDKDIIIWGSGNLAQTLMKEGLIDEYFLMVHPLVLGTGKKLFQDGSAKQELELTSSNTSKSGVIVLTYAVKK